MAEEWELTTFELSLAPAQLATQPAVDSIATGVASSGRADLTMPIPAGVMVDAFAQCTDPTCTQTMDLILQAEGAITEQLSFDLSLVPDEAPAILDVLLVEGSDRVTLVTGERADGQGIDTAAWPLIEVEISDGFALTNLDDDASYTLLACDDSTTTPSASTCTALPASNVAAANEDMRLLTSTSVLGGASCTNSPQVPYGIYLVDNGRTCAFSPIEVVSPRLWAIADCDGDNATYPADCDDADPTISPNTPETCSDGLDNDCSPPTNDLCDVRRLDSNNNILFTYNTIDEAVAAAFDGEIIDLQPRTYTNIAVQTEKVLSFQGPTGTVVEGSGAGSVFAMELPPGQPPSAGLPDVVFDGLTIQGGANTDGGGVLVRNANLIVRNCIITGNQVAISGGGIAVWGDLSLSDTVVSNNYSAQNGGGVALPSTPNALFNNVEIIGNTAPFGAGLYLERSAVTLDTTTIHANTGGGVGFRVSDGGQGPVVARRILGGDVFDNIGGGVIIELASNGDPIILNNISIRDNTNPSNASNVSGTGLVVRGNGVRRVDATNLMITGNQGRLKGGGFRMEAPNGTLNFLGGSITNNSSNLGGGGYIEDGSILLQGQSEVRYNSATNGAAGIYMTGGELDMCSTNLNLADGIQIPGDPNPQSFTIATGVCYTANETGITLKANCDCPP